MKLIVNLVLMCIIMSTCDQTLAQQSAKSHSFSTEPVLKFDGQYFVNWELFGLTMCWKYEIEHPGRPLPEDLIRIRKMFDSHMEEGVKLQSISSAAGESREFIETSAIRSKLLPLLSKTQKAELHDQMQGYIQKSVRLADLLRAVNPNGELNGKYFGNDKFTTRLREIEADYERKINELRSQAWKEVMKEIDPEDREKIDKMLMIDGLADK